MHLPTGSSARYGRCSVGIVVLWAPILLTLMLFWRITPAAGWLMAPYLAWVSFATALNLAIWRHIASR